MSLLKKLLLAGFFLTMSFSYLSPITEGDFFWHLKSGQDIWQSGFRPSSQWLGQLMLYLLWKVSGFEGIVLMRAIVYISALGVLFFWMKKQGVPFFLGFFLLFFPAHMFLSFPSERPQIFSFLLFPVTLFLLETFRDETFWGRILKKAYWLLPLIIIAWANIHPGFLLGIVCIWSYFFGELISFIKGKTSPGRLTGIGAVSLSPALIMIFRPEVLKAVPQMAASALFPSGYVKSIMEYLPPLTAALRLQEYYPSYWIFLAVTLFAVIKNIKRMPFVHLLLIVFFAGISLNSLRFMPFMLMLAPVVGSAFLHKKDPAGEASSLWEKSRVLLAGFSLIVVLWAALLPGEIRPGISREFPEGAARFIREVKPQGEIFNYQGWSGYLIWALPEREIFMPVENVSSDVDDAYEKIIWAERAIGFGGRPLWRSLLDAYGIDIIIIPGISPVSGEFFPLTDTMMVDRDWFLIYSDDVSNIFVRDTPANSGIIGIYSLPKANAYLQIISEARRHLKGKPRSKAFLRSLSYARSRLRR